MTTKFLVDTNNHTGYAQVVEEIVGSSVQKQFTFGHDLISQRIGAAVSFYQYDGHGSVRQLTNTAGAITDTYTYDAFGNVINRTGSTANDYLYAGEQFDGNLGFYYLRARYMNPSSGRFHSQDSYEGVSTDPISLHKYLYANGNSVNRTDPSGNFSIAIEVGALGMRSTLNSMSTLQSIAVAAAITCAIDYAVTGTLNEAGAELQPITPCDAPNKPEDNVEFAHGTSSEFALSINTIGVDASMILGSGSGSWYPGAFFTFLLEPDPALAIQLAAQFSLRRSPPRAVMIGKLPRKIFNSLKSSGAILSPKLDGADYNETLFLPQSFASLNRHNRGKWKIIPVQ